MSPRLRSVLQVELTYTGYFAVPGEIGHQVLSMPFFAMDLLSLSLYSSWLCANPVWFRVYVTMTQVICVEFHKQKCATLDWAGSCYVCARKWRCHQKRAYGARRSRRHLGLISGLWKGRVLPFVVLSCLVFSCALSYCLTFSLITSCFLFFFVLSCTLFHSLALCCLVLFVFLWWGVLTLSCFCLCLSSYACLSSCCLFSCLFFLPLFCHCPCLGLGLFGFAFAHVHSCFVHYVMAVRGAGTWCANTHAVLWRKSSGNAYLSFTSFGYWSLVICMFFWSFS